MKLTIALLAGDGIGPEVTAEAVKAMELVAARGGHTFDFKPLLIGGVAITAHGNPLPEETLKTTLACDAALLGAVGDNKFNALPPSERPEAGLLKIRAALGGFANLRPAIASKALADNSPLRPEITEGVDILFVRELLGGLYFGEPRWWDREKKLAHNTMVYSVDEVARVSKIAFELAQKRKKKVTSVDKANVLEVSQLWRATVTEIAKGYPDVTLEHQLGLDGDPPDEYAAQLRRGAHRKSLRRHSFGRERRDYGIAGHATLRDARRQGEPVRAGAWLCSRHCRSG